MGLQLGIVSQSFGATEDQSWLGSYRGTSQGDSLTLSAATFVTLCPTGVVPSGILLQKITAGGKYGPLDVTTPAADGRQLITQAAAQTIYVLMTTVDFTNGGLQAASANWQDASGAGLPEGQLITAKLPYSSGAGGPTQAGVLTVLQQFVQRYQFV